MTCSSHRVGSDAGILRATTKPAQQVGVANRLTACHSSCLPPLRCGLHAERQSYGGYPLAFDSSMNPIGPIVAIAPFRLSEQEQELFQNALMLRFEDIRVVHFIKADYFTDTSLG